MYVNIYFGPSPFFFLATPAALVAFDETCHSLVRSADSAVNFSGIARTPPSPLPPSLPPPEVNNDTERQKAAHRHHHHKSFQARSSGECVELT